MCSACLVRTRFILNIFSGIGLGCQDPPCLRPWVNVLALASAGVKAHVSARPSVLSSVRLSVCPVDRQQLPAPRTGCWSRCADTWSHRAGGRGDGGGGAVACDWLVGYDIYIYTYTYTYTYIYIYDTIRYDTRCYFNVRSKANMSQLNLPHGTDN